MSLRHPLNAEMFGSKEIFNIAGNNFKRRGDREKEKNAKTFSFSAVFALFGTGKEIGNADVAQKSSAATASSDATSPLFRRSNLTQIRASMTKQMFVHLRLIAALMRHAGAATATAEGEESKRN